MRVTQTMLGSMLQSDLQNVQAQMLQTQQELATGHRILQPSDHPIATENVLQWQAGLAQNTQYQANASDAASWLSQSQSALQSAVGLAQKVRTLAVGAGAGTLTTAERAAIAQQIQSVQASLVGVANTQVGAHYLFSGEQTATQPFVSGSTGVTYAGGGGSIVREIGPGVMVTVNTLGSVFTPVFGAIGQILSDLGSSTTVGKVTGSDLTQLDQALNGLIGAQGQSGAQSQQVTQAQGQLEAMAASLQQLRASGLDTNVARTVVRLQEQQTSYQSALAVGAQLLQPTLAKYLP